jgi:enoyl-CoA hydratase/carnithine racemase
MSESHVLCEVKDRVALITLNRPERRNAFTWPMGDALHDAFRRFDADDDVRAMVVTGAGRSFCAGAELGARREKTFEQRHREGEPAQRRVAIRPWEVRKPIIAAINGAAVGVGLTLPLQWDIRIAALDAKLGFVFVRRGVIPEAMSTWILPRLVGVARAAELLLSGRIFSGEEAAALGVVSEAVPRQDVLPRALELARDIAVHTAPVSVALAKRMLWEHLGSGDPVAAGQREAKAFWWCGRQPDAREGVTAFLEKREPRWSMRPSTDLPEIDPL